MLDSFALGKYYFLMNVLCGGTAGQGPVGEVPCQQGSEVRGHDLDSPQEDNKQAREMLRSETALARTKGQGLLIKWLFPAIPK